MKQYLDLLRDVIENGNDRGDRTGTGTRSIFGRMIRFDLNAGFPIVTTKSVPFKSLTAELLWFLKGSTNNVVLEKMGSTIWREWSLEKKHILLTHEERKALCIKHPHDVRGMQNYITMKLAEDPTFDVSELERVWMNRANFTRFKTNLSVGDLGPIYSAMWRRVPYDGEELITIDIRVGPKQGPVSYPEHVKKLERIESTYVGDLPVFWENNGWPFRIIQDVSITGEKNSIYLIQFDNTNYVLKITRPNIRAGLAYDPYQPTVSGVGCNGVIDGPIPRHIYDIWNNMIARCHRVTNPSYDKYGAKGVYVSPRWLCFENFFHDIKELPNYERWCEMPSKYHLDKDYFGSGCYDVSTCLFLNKDINHEQTNITYIKAMSPDGDVSYHYGQEALIKHLGVCLETLRNYKNDRFSKSTLDGWIFEEMVPPEGKLLRRRVYVDQITDVIWSLKNKPNSRRHIVSAWVPQYLPDETKTPHQNVLNGKMALAPCHCFFQFYVTEKPNITGVVTKHLSCLMYIRSNDAFLGCPFNIASYALLTHLMARECNMDVGELIYTMGDFHVYQNHFDQVDQLLAREPKRLPILILNPEIKSIFDFKVEDISLVGYDPHPPIKADVAV